MHDHDSDLIMALAEGRLPGSEREAAEASITACTSCSAELHAQQLALEALRAAPAAPLETAERDHLRATLRRELRLEAPEVSGRSAPAPALRWWQRPLAGVAAAALVLLTLVVVTPQFLSVGGDDASFDAAEATTTTASFDRDTAAQPETTALDGAADGTDPAATDELQSGDDGGISTAPGDRTTGGEGPATALVPPLEPIDLGRLAAEVEEGGLEPTAGAIGDLDARTLARCADAALDAFPAFDGAIALTLGTFDGVPALALRLTDLDGETESLIVAAAVDDCRVLATR